MQLKMTNEKPLGKKFLQNMHKTKPNLRNIIRRQEQNLEKIL